MLRYGLKFLGTTLWTSHRRVWLLQVVKEGSGLAANAAGSMAIPMSLACSRLRLKTTRRNFTFWDFCPYASSATCMMIWSRHRSINLPSGHKKFPGMSWLHGAYHFHRKFTVISLSKMHHKLGMGKMTVFPIRSAGRVLRDNWVKMYFDLSHLGYQEMAWSCKSWPLMKFLSLLRPRSWRVTKSERDWGKQFCKRVPCKMLMEAALDSTIAS